MPDNFVGGGKRDSLFYVPPPFSTFLMSIAPY
ncbi:hypothetical protein M8J77_010500 [Diaphorina citri]|nr:hypothetical protein M8J77_010500 [Diaphorina citri]